MHCVEQSVCCGGCRNTLPSRPGSSSCCACCNLPSVPPLIHPARPWPPTLLCPPLAPHPPLPALGPPPPLPALAPPPPRPQVQTIGLLSHLRANKVYGPFLILGPLSVLPNWVSEVERWCPSQPVILYHGSRQERAELRARHMPTGAQAGAGPAHAVCEGRGWVGWTGACMLRAWLAHARHPTCQQRPCQPTCMAGAFPRAFPPPGATLHPLITPGPALAHLTRSPRLELTHLNPSPLPSPPALRPSPQAPLAQTSL